jgi:hypothetical protein
MFEMANELDDVRCKVKSPDRNNKMKDTRVFKVKKEPKKGLIFNEDETETTGDKEEEVN